MAIMAVKCCEWVVGGWTPDEAIVLVSGGELRATPSAPALGEGNV